MKKTLDIIYEDKEILVVNKKSKMLTINTDSKPSINLYSYARDYVYKKNQKVFIVHRLDRETSGVIIFAKNDKAKKHLQDHWNTISQRHYLAIVEGKVEKKKAVLQDYLSENNFLEVYVSNKKNGKLAITEYEVLKQFKDNALLKVNIKTGRKNQIRCQLANLGHPIVGDKKYNAKTNYYSRLALHAHVLKIVHPKSKKQMEFIAPIPKEFKVGEVINEKNSSTN